MVELAPLPYSPGRSTRYSISSIFLSPFLHVTKMSASTSTISFWLELDSGILSLKSAFLWPSIYMAHNVELFVTFFIWILYIPYSSFPFSLSCKSMSYNGCSALHRVNAYLKKILKNALMIGFFVSFSFPFLNKMFQKLNFMLVFGCKPKFFSQILFWFWMSICMSIQDQNFTVDFSWAKTFLGFQISIQVFTFYCR